MVQYLFGESTLGKVWWRIEFDHSDSFVEVVIEPSSIQVRDALLPYFHEGWKWKTRTWPDEIKRSYFSRKYWIMDEEDFVEQIRKKALLLGIFRPTTSSGPIITWEMIKAKLEKLPDPPQDAIGFLNQLLSQ